jgi:hypothetical protein
MPSSGDGTPGRSPPRIRRRSSSRRPSAESGAAGANEASRPCRRGSSLKFSRMVTSSLTDVADGPSAAGAPDAPSAPILRRGVVLRPVLPAPVCPLQEGMRGHLSPNRGNAGARRHRGSCRGVVPSDGVGPAVRPVSRSSRGRWPAYLHDGAEALRRDFRSFRSDGVSTPTDQPTAAIVASVVPVGPVSRTAVAPPIAEGEGVGVVDTDVLRAKSRIPSTTIRTTSPYRVRRRRGGVGPTVVPDRYLVLRFACGI